MSTNGAEDSNIFWIKLEKETKVIMLGLKISNSFLVVWST
jgi:hypothetical protein